MANNVRNCIRFIGNESVLKCMKEINDRIAADSDPSDPHRTGVIGRVLYGLKGKDAFLSYDAIGGKWVVPEIDDDEKLIVTTGWDPARNFQDYLLRHLTTLDPNVIVAMDYDDEMPNFLGVRYVLMKGMVQRTYERELETTNMEMYGYEEVEEARSRNEVDEGKEIITWEDLWEKQMDLLEDAYAELKAENPATYSDPALRWRANRRP
jgi:hypothetical protein